MLTFAKILGKRDMPVFEILLARSSSILIIALIVCAKDGVNPFGNRYPCHLFPTYVNLSMSSKVSLQCLSTLRPLFQCCLQRFRTDDANLVDMPRIVCYLLGAVGHLVRLCPQPTIRNMLLLAVLCQ